ncbi:MAG: LLM class flavin-dependent oxidoreductase [Mycobacterium sp.]|uniref:LLM class flavin-dependent oxidoreductase n=1 Tax=Mycobacterium sp. TaxID=1785 RepID=UPI003CC0019D
MTHFRVGLSTQLLHSRFSPTAIARVDLMNAKASGVDSYWVADHLNSLFPRSIATPPHLGAAKLAPKIDAQLEPWTMLGYLAARNRVGRLRFGMGVTDASRRLPAVTAQAAATLHLLTQGRAILGLGVGEREGNEPYGVDWTKPVARFEEAVATIRALWNSGGDLVSRESPYFPLRDAVFDLPPYRGKWPEIWIAARGPRMLRITGRYADAWFPGLISRPRDYATGLDAVKTAASNAGRDPSSVIPALSLFVVTGRRSDDVEQTLGSDAAKALALNIPAPMWADHGVPHPLGPDFAGAQDLIPQTLDEETVLSYIRDVPRSLLKAALLTGTPSEVIDQAAELRDHGLRYLVVSNVSILQPSLGRGLQASAPFFKILRGLKKL